MSIIRTITEGGQTWSHQVRMLKQVIKTALLLSLLLWSALFGYQMYQIDPFYYQAAWYHLQAQFSSTLFIDQIAIDSHTWSMIANEYSPLQQVTIRTEKLLHYTEPYYNYFSSLASKNFERSGLAALLSYAGIALFFFVRGKLSKQKQHVSGKKIVAPWRIALQLKLSKQASKIKLGRLSFVKDTETQHLLITGGTGSGKTNCLHHILPQVRTLGQKAIIIDTTGIFVERYYREGVDIILNPFDDRSSQWHPWVECQERLDYEALAESFIPQSYSELENYWRIAARSLLSSLLLKTAQTKSNSELTRWALFESLANLCSYVKDTKAASHLDMSSEKTASSIRSVSASFLGCLEFLQDTNAPFSIREWTQKEDNNSWLFLACKPHQRATLNPLLSCWFSVAARSLMQMPTSFERKVWFILDELPSLHRLKDLETLLSESRKYGGCALLALQSPAQLEAIYGREITQTIIGNCATKIVFAEQDPEIAEKISKAFGEREIKEYQEGLSYGANDVRDGVNLSLQVRNQPLVSATLIQSLERNEAFIKLPGNLPIAKIKLSTIKS